MTEKTKTNADRIREMSDEELANSEFAPIICDMVPAEWCYMGRSCYECRLAWLRSTVEESETKERKWEMSNVVEQFTPNPVTHEHGENGCGKNPRAWEMEMMHQVWAAGLHDAANCFQDALEAKWKLESQRKVKPKTNSDRIRSMTDKARSKFSPGIAKAMAEQWG